MTRSLSPYLVLMRPQQWVKNLLILAPAFFAGKAFVPEAMIPVLTAVVAFSLVASAVYVFNDLLDCAEDARHPRKCLRPLPSGKARKRHAAVFAIMLLIAGMGVAATVPLLSPLLAGYVVLNGIYTRFLKRVPVIDITLVASFYVFRIAAGGVAAAAVLSPWIILATFFLALFLVSGKRFGEFGREGRRVALQGYSKQSLEGLLIASAVLAVASYGLWTVLSHASPYTVYSVIPVFAVIFRTLNRMHFDPETAEAPELLVFRDPWTLMLTLVWGVDMLLALYLV